MNLYERDTWLNPDLEYLFGSKIIEYDMKSAGLSLSKEYKLLPDNILADLSTIQDKKERNIRIGLIQRNDAEYRKKLAESFKDARRRFFEANKLDKDSILSIKKDAFFLIDTICKTTEIGELKFVPKNTYTSYTHIGKLEFYYNTREWDVDIKGLGQGADLEKIKERHMKHMLDWMLQFARYMEVHMDVEELSAWAVRFIRKYRGRQLDVGYYRELSQLSTYDVDFPEGKMQMMDITPDMLEMTNIEYNYFNIIVPLASLLV